MQITDTVRDLLHTRVGAEASIMDGHRGMASTLARVDARLAVLDPCGSMTREFYREEEARIEAEMDADREAEMEVEAEYQAYLAEMDAGR